MYTYVNIMPTIQYKFNILRLFHPQVKWQGKESG